MKDLTRRGAVKLSAGLTLASSAAMFGAADAFEPPPQTVKQGKRANIERYELTPEIPGVPRLSWAVARGDMVYVSGVTANTAKLGDIKDQTLQVLERIDALLAKAGTNKSNLLTAQVWLTDMSLFAAHNEAWNTWVDLKNPPARACLMSAQLWSPGVLVEIMATAAR